MGYAALMIMEGSMTPGELTSMLLYLGVLVPPIVQMSNIVEQATHDVPLPARMADMRGCTTPNPESDQVRFIEVNDRIKVRTAVNSRNNMPRRRLPHSEINPIRTGPIKNPM